MQNIKNKKIKERQMSKVKCQMFKAGFSLIEVLVSLLVLSMGFAAVFTLMANNIKSSENAKNQIIASQLAQEGIELVRNMKDNEKLDTPTYSTQVACDTSSSCINQRVDYNSLPSGLRAGDKKLYLRGDFYEHQSGGGTLTKFYRRIDLSITGNSGDSPSTREITVTTYVTWNGSGFIANINDAGLAAGNCNIANKCVSVVSVLPDYLSN